MRQLNRTALAAGSGQIDPLIGQLLGGIEKIEIELRRLTGDKDSGSVRSGASQPVPPGYADAVAEYSKRLSKDR